MEKEEIEEQVMAMHRAGFQVCIHANGDLTIDMVLTAYEKAQKAHPRADTRHRIEHCTLVNPDLLARMKALGCIATPFCTYVYHHGEKMRYYGEQQDSNPMRIWCYRLQRVLADFSKNGDGPLSFLRTHYYRQGKRGWKRVHRPFFP